jgi:nitrate reductase NapE
LTQRKQQPERPRDSAPRRRLRVSDSTTEVSTRSQERRSLIFLSVVMAPVLAVALVTGYGFLVWVYQMFAGPPGS